jgi:hypothetical protein
MNARNKKETADEIRALEQLKPVGPFAEKTKRAIQTMIDALAGNIDETAKEFLEMSDEDRDAYNDAYNWKEGLTRNKPSESFGGLIA